MGVNAPLSCQNLIGIKYKTHTAVWTDISIMSPGNNLNTNQVVTQNILTDYFNNINNLMKLNNEEFGWIRPCQLK